MKISTLFLGVVVLAGAASAGRAVGLQEGREEGRKAGYSAALYDVSSDASMDYIMCFGNPPACEEPRQVTFGLRPLIDRRLEAGYVGRHDLDRQLADRYRSMLNASRSGPKP